MINRTLLFFQSKLVILCQWENKRTKWSIWAISELILSLASISMRQWTVCSDDFGLIGQTYYKSIWHRTTQIEVLFKTKLMVACFIQQFYAVQGFREKSEQFRCFLWLLYYWRFRYYLFCQNVHDLLSLDETLPLDFRLRFLLLETLFVWTLWQWICFLKLSLLYLYVLITN